MVMESSTAQQTGRSLQARHVFLIAAVCLVAGLATGYAVRGARMPAVAASAPAHSMPPGHPDVHAAPRPSLQQVQQMADQQAAPLLEKLKSDPKNAALLVELGGLYHATHRFQQAAAYYGRAVEADPKNASYRTKLAASLYRGGDADGALAQLRTVLEKDPKDASALFNVGVIDWEGKQDARGALDAWRQLLKTNPQLSAERKAMVQQLMAQAEGTPGGGARN